MTRALRRAVALTVGSLVLGCGLVSGLDPLHVGDVDAAIEAGPDGGLACEAGCGFALPAGFSIVTFATVLPATCPNGTTPQPFVADPAVAADACSCKCTMTTKATCSASNVEIFIGDSGLSSCTSLSTILSASPGCHTTTFTLPSNTRADNTPVGVTVTDAGACGTSAVADASTLTTPSAQICAPTSCAASDALCAPPAGQKLCVKATGDVPCPAPFTEKHVVGTKASVACSACGPECTINPQNCSNSKLTLYTDTACTTGSQNVSSCFTIVGQMAVKSYEFTLTASGGCTTTQTSSASTALTEEQTVCCMP